MKHILEDDDGLMASLKGIEYQHDLAGNIKRGFTNIGVHRFQDGDITKEQQRFNDLYFRDRNNDITLTNLEFKVPLVARMNQIHPDLYYNSLDVLITFNDMHLIGDFEMVNADQVDILPILNHGQIEIIIKNAEAIGKIALRPFNDTFDSTNYDLTYNTGQIIVRVISPAADNQSVYSEETKNSIEESIVKNFKVDLWDYAEQVIKSQMNKVLHDLSISHLFANNVDLITRYRHRGDVMNALANVVADKIIEHLSKSIQEELTIDDFSIKFSHNWGIFRIWGGFIADHGYVKNLRTLKRTDNFSIVFNNKTGGLTVFGGIGLQELSFGYRHYKAHIWTIGPSGNIITLVGNNSVSFKVDIEKPKPELRNNKVKLYGYQIKIKKLDNFDFQITGLGESLNWLISLIISWMMGVLKTVVRFVMQAKMNAVLDKFIEKESIELPIDGMFINN